MCFSPLEAQGGILQIVPLLQGGTSIFGCKMVCFVSQHSLQSREEIPEDWPLCRAGQLAGLPLAPCSLHNRKQVVLCISDRCEESGDAMGKVMLLETTFSIDIQASVAQPVVP